MGDEVVNTEKLRKCELCNGVSQNRWVHFDWYSNEHFYLCSECTSKLKYKRDKREFD